MKITFLGSYKGYAIENHGGTFKATGWNCETNCSKVWFEASTEKKLERMINKNEGV